VREAAAAERARRGLLPLLPPPLIMLQIDLDELKKTCISFPMVMRDQMNHRTLYSAIGGRADPPPVNPIVYLYTGMRGKACSSAREIGWSAEPRGVMP
jgi:hypothetical protein